MPVRCANQVTRLHDVPADVLPRVDTLADVTPSLQLSGLALNDAVVLALPVDDSDHDVPAPPELGVVGVPAHHKAANLVVVDASRCYPGRAPDSSARTHPVSPTRPVMSVGLSPPEATFR